MRDIGKNIRDLRTAKGITQDALAEKLFVTRQTVSNYENGKSRPDIDMIARISEVLECEVNDIIYGTSNNIRKKQEHTKLAVGAVVSFVLIALYEFIYPVVSQIKFTNYFVAPAFFVQLTLLPLTWLFIGWTIMQLAGTAFKTRIAVPKWTKYLKYALIVFIVLFFTAVIIAVLPTAVENLIFLERRKAGTVTEYVSNIPPQFTSICQHILSHFIYLFIFPKNLITPVFLSSGILLWLCEFPKTKCHHG